MPSISETLLFAPLRDCTVQFPWMLYSLQESSEAIHVSFAKSGKGKGDGKGKDFALLCLVTVFCFAFQLLVAS